MAPIPIQIVFQGGGAKLCALLAAAEAIQKLEDANQVEVKRVAGTSAGAIVASLYAARIPMERTRERLMSIGKNHLKLIAPRRNRIRKMIRVAFGLPLYSEENLRELLYILFEIDGKKFTKFADLHIPLRITATDMRNSERLVFGDKSDDSLIDRMVDSCALPIIFRTATRGGVVLDGGLCENLPGEDLITEQDEYGRVVGVSFAKKQTQIPSHPLKYLLRLLSVSIDNSVDRTSKLVGDSHVHKIKTDIDTFDFKEALERGLADPHYDSVRGKCHEWLNLLTSTWKAAQAPVIIEPGPEPIPPHELAARVHQVHWKSVKRDHLQLPSAALLVTANCLLPAKDARSSLPDDIQQVVRLAPSSQPLPSFSLGLASSGVSPVMGATQWEVVAADQSMVDFTAIPLASELRHEVIFFFAEPLAVSQEPYEIRQRNNQKNSLIGLEKEGRDWIQLTSMQSKMIDCFDVVIYLPEAYRNCMLAQLPPDTGQGDNVSIQNLKTGRAMTLGELTAYPTPLHGFVRLGWRTQGVAGGERVGVLLVKGT